MGITNRGTGPSGTGPTNNQFGGGGKDPLWTPSGVAVGSWQYGEKATADLMKYQQALHGATMSMGGFNADYQNMLDISRGIIKDFPTSVDVLGKLSSGIQQAGASARATNKDFDSWLRTGALVQKVMGLSAETTGQWIREMDDLGKSAGEVKAAFSTFYTELGKNNLTMQDGNRIIEDAQKAWRSYGGTVGETQEDLVSKFTALSGQMKALNIDTSVGMAQVNQVANSGEARLRQVALVASMSGRSQKEVMLESYENAAKFQTDVVANILKPAATAYPDMFGKSWKQVKASGGDLTRFTMMQEMESRLGKGSKVEGAQGLINGYLNAALDQGKDIAGPEGIANLASSAIAKNAAKGKFQTLDDTNVNNKRVDAEALRTQVERAREAVSVGQGVELLKQIAPAVSSIASAVGWLGSMVDRAGLGGIGGVLLGGAVTIAAEKGLIGLLEHVFLGKNNPNDPLNILKQINAGKGGGAGIGTLASMTGLANAHICCNAGCLTGIGGAAGGAATAEAEAAAAGAASTVAKTVPGLLARTGLYAAAIGTAAWTADQLFGKDGKIWKFEEQWADFTSNFENNGGMDSLIPHGINPHKALSRIKIKGHTLDEHLFGGGGVGSDGGGGGGRGGVSDASFYGTPQDGYGFRPGRMITASGEKFNPEGLTVAKRTFGPTSDIPFGTLVEFTNPKTGKRVVAKVTDTGPLAGNREFDLSHGTAAALGVVEAGVSKLPWKVVGQAPIIKAGHAAQLARVAQQGAAASSLGHRNYMAALKESHGLVKGAGHCLAAVSRALHPLGVNLYGNNDAAQAEKALRNDPRFIEVPASEAQEGDIKLWGATGHPAIKKNGKLIAPKTGHPWGHSEVAGPGGHGGASDFVHSNEMDSSHYSYLHVFRQIADTLQDIRKHTGTTASAADKVAMTPPSNSKNK